MISDMRQPQGPVLPLLPHPNSPTASWESSSAWCIRTQDSYWSMFSHQVGFLHSKGRKPCPPLIFCPALRPVHMDFLLLAQDGEHFWNFWHWNWEKVWSGFREAFISSVLYEVALIPGPRHSSLHRASFKGGGNREGLGHFSPIPLQPWRAAKSQHGSAGSLLH